MENLKEQELLEINGGIVNPGGILGTFLGFFSFGEGFKRGFVEGGEAVIKANQ